MAKVMTCPVTVKQLNGWPPSLPQFISYAKGEIDYDGAFTRCLAKKPEGRIEKYVYQQCSYNVRVSTDTEARRIHKREMNLAVELDRKGDLELQEEAVKALPVNSVKNENDLARERYEASGKRNPIQDRIDAIRKAKK